MRVMPELKNHLPVVVHANYHQPKEPRMAAVFDRWHKGIPDALDAFAKGEPATTVPAPALERDFLHQINDGFVSGSYVHDAQLAARSVDGGRTCAPRPSAHGVAVTLHHLPQAECASSKLCASVRRAAAKRAADPTDPEILLIIAPVGDAKQVQPADGAALSSRRTHHHPITS